MRKIGTFVFFCSGLMVAGCATTPPVEVSYYHAAGEAEVKIVQLASCSKPPKGIEPQHFDYSAVVFTDVLITASYKADTESMHTVDIEALSSLFADADIEFEWTDDGRLKSVNATQVGKGKEIIKAAGELAGTLLSIDPNLTDTGAREKQKRLNNACRVLRSLSEKPFSLTRIAKTDFGLDYVRTRRDYVQKNPGEELGFDGRAESLAGDEISQPFSEEAWRALRVIFGNPKVDYTVDTSHAPRAGLKESGQVSGGANALNSARDHLVMRTPAVASIVVGVSSEVGGSVEKTANVVVPQFGNRYALPLPKPVVFGTSGIKLKYSDSGRLMAAGFKANPGTADGIASVGTTIDAITTTDSEELTATKTENDLIKAQREQMCLRYPDSDRCE